MLHLKHFKSTFFPLLIILLGVNLNAQTKKFPFQNPKLSTEERVEDLIARLTLEEKVGQLLYNSPAVDRIGLPEYNWWNECLHGVARNGRATIFPQAIGMAATWDTDLMQRVGDAISTEARAKYNVSIKNGYRGRYQGLTFWTPNINIFRDPRWGRGQETYGEDPYLTSRIGVSFVKGLQGDHPKYLKSAGMAKHFAVHNGPEGSRHEFDAKVGMKDLWETYLPAFEALVTEAKVEGVMGAYNRTNGVPCCAHPYLMQDILRKQWKFEGYFVSDCWAIVDFYEGHKIVETPAEAAALGLNTGCNLNCGDTYPELVKAIEQGLTTEKALDDNLRELLPTRFKLGLFDPFGTVPFDNIKTSEIGKPEHIALTKEAATKSIVLLKNKNNLLPIKKDIGSVFVSGPMATHAQALLANYYGVSGNLVTFLEGITAKASPQTAVRYSQGALMDMPNRNPIDWFSENGKETEVTIACVGISQLIEGEEGESIASAHKGDRVDLKLPQNQIDFLKKMRTTAENLVVVVTAGSAVNLEEIYEIADAVLFVWYPGEQGGAAVADVIFGEVSPSGKLPVTFPKSVADLPDFNDYAMKGRTYRYAEKEPMFPFGFGLSYTKFDYSNLTLSKRKLKNGEGFKATVTLTNSGKMEAEEVVQLYLKDMESTVDLPKMSLKAFRRIQLKAGESQQITFEVSPKMLEMIDNDGVAKIENGDFKIFIGGAAPMKRSIDLGASLFVEGDFSVK